MSAATPYRHLRPGHFYRLVRPFTDHDGIRREPPQVWRFVSSTFLPYEDGLTLSFTDDRGNEFKVRLQDRVEEQASVVENLAAHMVKCDAPNRYARAGIRAVHGDDLIAFDGVDRFALTWADISRVTAAYGRQQYDMTRCLEIDHRRGTVIFLPETEPLWNQFISGLETHLDGAVPEQQWSATLSKSPESAVTVWRRQSLKHRIFNAMRGAPAK